MTTVFDTRSFEDFKQRLGTSKTILVSVLMSILKIDSSRLSASSRCPEDVKNADWRCRQNEDGVESTYPWH